MCVSASAPTPLLCWSCTLIAGEAEKHMHTSAGSQSNRCAQSGEAEGQGLEYLGCLRRGARTMPWRQKGGAEQQAGRGEPPWTSRRISRPWAQMPQISPRQGLTPANRYGCGGRLEYLLIHYFKFLTDQQHCTRALVCKADKACTSPNMGYFD